jgi:hypothetical protein
MSKHRHGKGKFRRMQKMRQHQQQMNMTQQGQGMIQPGTGMMQQQTGVMQPAAGSMPAAVPVAATPMQQPPPLPKKAVASGALPLHYEFITGDLKRIGILTAIVVVILIVLYIFLK